MRTISKRQRDKLNRLAARDGAAQYLQLSAITARIFGYLKYFISLRNKRASTSA
jgi:hypothetical protein